MLTVLEVDRKRKSTRPLPPGFPANSCLKNTNNSSTLRQAIQYPSCVVDISCEDARTANLYPRNMNNCSILRKSIKYPSRVVYTSCEDAEIAFEERWLQNMTRKPPKYRTNKTPQNTTKSTDYDSPMMPVTMVAIKRSKFKSQPPGFPTIKSSADINNNSKDKQKLNILGGVFMAMMKAKSEEIEKNNNQGDGSRTSLKDRGRTSRERAVNRSPASVERNRKRVPSKRRWFGMKYKLFPFLPPSLKEKKERIWALTTEMEVAGEQVLVNIHNEFSGSDVMDWSYVLDERLTPENYASSSVYYDHVIENRRAILKAIYVLGDMLLMEEVEGDREAWLNYTEQALQEEQKWKEKCKESNEYFRKTGGRILGQSEPCYRTLLRLLRRVTKKAGQHFSQTGKHFSEACPCVVRNSG